MSSKNNLIEHPGTFIKESVIPQEMTVTQAAKAIGVGRPALSNLLNCNANLSAEMAAKLEKAFGIDAGLLLAKQSDFDAQKSAANTNTATVRTFVPPFAAPKANDIQAWSEQVDSRAKFAVLLRMLVNSTCDGLEEVDFPAYDDSQRPGWDGEVETEIGNPWVPIGRSGWEFGVNKSIKGKADKDYEKSVKATPKADRLKTTFVFVTPRRWPGKDTWREDQLKKKHWKDIRVLDASDLEQWLEQSIPAQVWFANENGNEFRGTSSLDRCWVKWNASCEPKFTTSIFDEASGIAGKKLIDHLRTEDRTLRLAADSVLEGLAFVFAMLDDEDGQLSAIRDRIVVFSEPGPLTELANKSASFIPIVISRDTEVELSETGVRLGGISVFPRTLVQSDADIVLDTLSGEAFRNALESMGLEGDVVERLKDESGCSLTVLRRRLAQDQAIKCPEWSLNTALASSVFPFMLAGAWQNDNEVDRLVLCHLAGKESFSEVNQAFTALKNVESTPVWAIGSYQGVISKIDALYAIQSSVTADDLKRFYDAAELVLSERDPSLDLPEKDRWAAGIYGKTRDISAALREGISDSLVILAIHGRQLFKDDLGFDTEVQATLLVRKLFANLDADTLESQNTELQRYAEAAPEEFLKIIERDLAKNESSTQSLMRPIGDPMFSRNPRVGLMWALDLLAWSPDWLPRVVEILAQLHKMEPDDQSGNSALHSLLSIFRSWMPQTSANIDQRIAAFDQLVRHHPDTAWIIARDQYDSRSRTGHFSVKPKWRDYAFGSGDVVTNGERWQFEHHCLETALSWTSLDRSKLADLVGSVEHFDQDLTDKVWELVTHWSKNASNEDRAWLRERIRTGVSRSARRLSRKGASKSETKAKVSIARDVYDTLTPDDVVWEHAWLFKNSWVEDSWEDIHGDDYDFAARDERIAKQRKSALKAVQSKQGINGIVSLARSGDGAHVVGNTLAEILTSKATQLEFVKEIVFGHDFLLSLQIQSLVSGFLFKLGTEKAIELIEELRSSLNNKQLVKLLCLCRFDGKVWDAVAASDEEVSDEYWQTVQANWSRQSEKELRLGVSKLLEYGRSLSALHFIHLDLKSVSSEQLYDVLKSLPNGRETDRAATTIDKYTIEKAFELLNTRGSVSQDRMAALEFVYLEVFKYDKGNIPNLQAEVNENPALLCDAISLAYKSKKDMDEVELTEERKKAAKNAHTFISALSAVPGVDEKGRISSEKLKDWILEARRLGDRSGHRNMVDYQIGELLAHAPDGDDEVWPCEPVREVINDLYSEDMEQGISIGRYNARGATWRGEGGAQERAIAKQYDTWAKACELEFPRTASVLRGMAGKYNKDAEWHDNEAMIRRRMRY
ncbi:MAG: HigA family addiction module antitoxin [Pseudomonadota bacterium]